MSEVKISAEPRTEFGKGGARRTRRAGLVPAVLYGHGEKPKHIALPAREFAAAIRKGGANQLFAIEVSDGTQVLALPKAIQRDPIKDSFEHVDLLLVRRGEKVTVEVPVQLTGEAAKNTLIVHDHDTLTVTADATKVPDHLEASIEGLEAGTQVTAADVALPAGVELVADPELSVAAVTAAPTAEQLEATLPEVEEAAAEAEAEVGEETAEGAEAPAAEGEQAPAEAKTEA
ncbi:50S ribosomal protein L25/general stress protein Ctc [Micromonospora sp. NBC_01655]|uniref:50S ribosomal protein L25/general stress protein Ctc n=1 Tax=Micromonospora sp. NBC_01655 TaxID=2975983 RepID=UPI00224DED00|nr:50S ribosomal protein L25/general stress protein Ctc [Micromonospora sp. NBC_01655]MCX4474467.1 50S ribosomal protein L25/general stress protein Ctc [Micromonospora sp. NBC_01655]